MRDPIHLIHRGVGALERRARRQLQDDEHVALILVGHESGGTRLHQPEQNAEQHGEGQRDERRVPRERDDRIGVAIAKRFEHPVE